MNAVAALSDRINHARRRQVQALHRPANGALKPPAPGRSEGAGALRHGGEAANDHHHHMPMPGREDLIGEMAALLPAATALYGYGAEDVEAIDTLVSADRPGVEEELRLLVRQWRIDVVAAGLDMPGLIGDAASEHARTQFRLDVMGVSHDENGQAYTSEQLRWALAGYLGAR